MSGEAWRLGPPVNARPPARALVGDAGKDAGLRAQMTNPARVKTLKCIRDIEVKVPYEETVQLRAGTTETHVAPNWPPLRVLSDREVIEHFDPVFHDPKHIGRYFASPTSLRERV
jgi:hypothetical protein